MENSNQIQVLVIEDDQYFAKLLRDILEIKGCIATCATSAVAGLRLISQIQPKIVFCDLNLPGEMSGLELARHIRTTPSLNHIALVAISGAADYGDGDWRSMFDMVFRKPVKFAELARAVDAYAVAGRRNSNVLPGSP